MRLIKGDDRFIHGYLNYRHAVSPDPLSAMGPTIGEYPQQVWPVEISADGKRVGISYTAPGEEQS